MRPAVLAGMVSAGVPLATALAGEEEIHPLVTMAIRLGTPLAPALRNLEIQLRARERIASEVSQAQAIPKATRRLLLWLPAVSVLLGELMGLGTLSGLLTPIGALALGLAALILWVGAKVSGKMLRSLRELDTRRVDELISLDMCLGAGVRLTEIPEILEGELSPTTTELIAFGRGSGAAMRSLISAEIDRINLELLDDHLAKAKRLSVALLIPLSLSTLPAFLLLTIPPMLIGITQ